MDFTNSAFIEDPFHSLEDLEGFNSAFPCLSMMSPQDCSQFANADSPFKTASQAVETWHQETVRNLWSSDPSSSSSRIHFSETKCCQEPARYQEYDIDYANVYINCESNFDIDASNTVPPVFSSLPFYDSDVDQNWNCSNFQPENRARQAFAGGEAVKSPVIRLPMQSVSKVRDRGDHCNTSYFCRKSVCMASSPQNEAQSSSNENSTVMNDSDLDLDNSTFASALKAKRRTPHNMIEKKYRSTINDAIRELKNIVSSPDEKLSKSGVLRSTLSYIYVLKQEKRKLQEEVSQLRKRLRDAGINVPEMPVVSTDKETTYSAYSSSASVSSNTSSLPLGPSEPMVDKARLTIFVLMFMFVVCNPLSIFVKNAPNNRNFTVVEDVIPGRMVLEYGEDFETLDSEGIWWQSPIVRPCFIWSVNIFVIICFLTRLLVFGEPVADADSSAWAYFLKLRTNAHAYVRSGDYTSAEKNLCECLKVLERPLPTAKYDEYISIIWQVIRHMLNSIWIGRCFSRIQRSSSKTVPVVCRSHAQTAIVYHLLNQLHLTRPNDSCEELKGLNLALCAVNLAESAGCSPHGLSHALMADIYITAALQMKLLLPSFIGAILSTYFMRRAKSHIKVADEGVQRKLMWLFHPLARSFLTSKPALSERLRGRSSTFFPYIRSCSCAKPVERLLAVFKMKLLKSLIEELDSSSGVGISYFREVSKLLITICTAPKLSQDIVSEIDVTSFDEQGDEVCSWWTNVFICALYWRDHKYGSAADHYAAVRHCPKTLLTEPTSLALGHALCSRKLCIHDRDNVKFPRIIWFHSSWSIARLRPLIFVDHGFRPSIVEFITNKVRLLSLEWLLISVFDVWQTSLDSMKPYWQQLPVLSVRWTYEEILTLYKSLAKKDEKCKHKISVYELVSRVLNGTNPTSIWNDPLLSTSGKQIHQSRLFYVANNETTHLIRALRELFFQDTTIKLLAD